jgi:hypothetical protein
MLKRLFLTKIFEGGVDLTTGEPIPHGLTISNGDSEVLVSVDEEAVNRIASLFCDLVDNSGEKGCLESYMPVPAVMDLAQEDSEDIHKEDLFPKKAPHLRIADEMPKQPGNQYDDELTGVSSL